MNSLASSEVGRHLHSSALLCISREQQGLFILLFVAANKHLVCFKEPLTPKPAMTYGFSSACWRHFPHCALMLPWL